MSGTPGSERGVLEEAGVSQGCWMPAAPRSSSGIQRGGTLVLHAPSVALRGLLGVRLLATASGSLQFTLSNFFFFFHQQDLSLRLR